MVSSDSWERYTVCLTSDECPDAAECTNPSPRGIGSYQLSPKYARTEGQDAEDKYRYVLASLGGRSKLTRGSQGGKLVDTGAYPCEDHATDKNIHAVSSRADDHAYNYKSCPGNGDVSSTKDITERANERTDCRQRQKVCQDEPDPTISAANVCVDIRRDLQISTARSIER
jgi:hypothetical protein